MIGMHDVPPNTFPTNINQYTDLPIGMLVEWLGSTTDLPRNWLLDGSKVRLTEYPELYNTLKSNVTLSSDGLFFTLPTTTRIISGVTVRGLFRARG